MSLCFLCICVFDVGKTMPFANRSPVITIFIDGTVAIPSHGWFYGIVLPTLFIKFHDYTMVSH